MQVLTAAALSKMFRTSVVVVAVALVGAALAYEHHGFISEVKHIPYKWYGGEGGMMGGGFGGSQVRSDIRV